ncbi:hypothetical protein BJ875DRAFT_512876 [Amylocarpus encephaloides]|uniref:J domain-containing protein n=1 Tax=Amylocarpus encephaloides TaxID=45428 RepID=A0A9P8C449_9HELO|nr:hypothetical protein BJ875DRAFT_512876 [Amylocarpus encephaloides]
MEGTMKDHYATLEIARYSQSVIIKAAYRQLILATHPDKVTEDMRASATERASQINEAYEVLREKDSKEQYDQDLKSWVQRNTAVPTTPFKRKAQNQQSSRAPPRGGMGSGSSRGQGYRGPGHANLSDENKEELRMKHGVNSPFIYDDPAWKPGREEYEKVFGGAGKPRQENPRQQRPTPSSTHPSPASSSRQSGAFGNQQRASFGSMPNRPPQQSSQQSSYFGSKPQSPQHNPTGTSRYATVLTHGETLQSITQWKLSVTKAYLEHAKKREALRQSLAGDPAKGAAQFAETALQFEAREHESRLDAAMDAGRRLQNLPRTDQNIRSGVNWVALGAIQASRTSVARLKCLEDPWHGVMMSNWSVYPGCDRCGEAGSPNAVAALEEVREVVPWDADRIVGPGGIDREALKPSIEDSVLDVIAA